MRRPLFSLVCRLTAGALLFQSAAPAGLAAKEVVDASLARRKLLPPKPMKGVPTMRVTPAVDPAAIRPHRPAIKIYETILNEVGRTKLPIGDGSRADWRAELARGNAASTRQGWLRLWLAEADLAREYPQTAVERLDALLRTKPSSVLTGLARHDRAECLFFMGRYGEARRAFEAELRGKGAGFDRREAALWVRHARGCEGYHLDNEKLGVPIPLRLDPMCGAAAVAVCLRALGLPHERALMAKTVRHTGEGSDLQDLADACDRLGVAANPVQATDKGLRALPLPAVAHVEGDHFVAVVDADTKGVEYVCSDCGAWPGGPVRVGWKAWRAMKPGAYLTVTRKGSPQQAAMDRVAPREDVTKALDGRRALPLTDVSVGLTQGHLVGEASRLVARLTGSVSPLYLWGGYLCGQHPNALHCPDCGPCCPEDTPGDDNLSGNGAPVDSYPRSLGSILGGLGSGGPSNGDPVNLATGEEEYRPAPDLTVYNPTGPSVSWGRIYNSMRSDGTMFGAGWSDTYNVGVEYSIGPIEPTASPNTVQANSASGKATSPQPAAKQPARTSCYVVFANGSQVQCFAPSSHGPTSYDPVIEFDPNPGIRLKAIGTYDSTTGLTSFRVVFADRTTWVTAPDQTYGYNFQRIHQLIDRNGNSIQFSYAYYNSMVRLTGIADASGAALLTLGLDANGNATSATDRYGRSVYYACGTPFSGNSSKTLTQVSQVVASGTTSPPVRYQYGYVNEGNGEATSGYVYLGSIAVPSPTGTGMATSTIAYDPYYVTVTSITDANGNRRLYSSTDWNGSSNANATTVKVEDPVGNVLYQYTVTFDGSMNKMSQKSADGQTGTSQSFGSGGATYKPGTVTDGLGHTWTRTYDTFGNTLTATTPKGTTTTFSYSYSNFAFGELTSVQQGSKTATSYSYYEPSGLPEEIDSPTPGTSGGGTVATSFTYDAVGNLTQVIAPGNNAATTRTTQFGYTTDGSYTQGEALGRPITVTDALGKVSHLRYDARGNLLSTTDALGNQSQSTFNLADQPLTTALPATGNTGSGHGTQSNVYLYPGGPAVESDALDESGNLVRAIYSTFGPEGETLAVSGAAESVSGTYDALYRAKTVSDGKGGATTFSYDAKGRLAEIDYPGASGMNADRVRFTSYDAVGRLLSRTDGNGQVTNYTFGDTDGLLTKVDYPGATANDVTMAYDGYGRLVSSTDATGASTTAYDDLGNVTSATRTYTGLPAMTQTYGYYPDGSRGTMTNAAGTWTYGYDADGRYATMASPAGTSTATYYDNGWQATRTLPNGLKTTYGYYGTGDLGSLWNSNGSGSTTYSSYGPFAYDGAFNRTGMTSAVPVSSAQGGSTTYAYDSKDRLTSESSTRLGGYSQANGYDAAGNPTTLRGTAQTFDGDNRQTGTGFAYDGDGNPTTYRGAALTFGPESWATAIGSSLTAGYRADGLRAWKQNASGNRTYFYYDGGVPILETDANGNLTAKNVYAPDGLVSTVRGGPWIYFQFDAEGSAAQRTDASGGTFSSTVYDAYGATTGTAGPAPTDPFGYHARDGYLLDRETGLILCGHRYYDPSAGRWLTRDPLGMGGGVDLYGYCQSGPIGHADPAGLAMDSVSEYCEKFPNTCADLMKIIGGMGGGTAVGRAVQAAEESGEEDPAMSVLGNMEPNEFGNLMHGYIRGWLSDNFEGWNPDEFFCTRGVGRIDAINLGSRRFFEIKAAGGGDDGWEQISRYTGYLNRALPGTPWKGVPLYYPSPFHPEGWGLVPPGLFD